MRRGHRQIPFFSQSVIRSPSMQGISLFGMVDATCLFSVGHHQVCGEPAVDQVGSAPPGSGQLYEVPTCEHYLQLMVETYIGGAQVAHAERSATASQAERKETATPRVEHDSSFRMALPRLARRAR
jgi:hypothetical protein